MGSLLNTYQRMKSPTGKEVTLFTDNAPWRENPWKEIKEAGRRYRNLPNGGYEIQQWESSGGDWIPVNDIDADYWNNYIKQIESKATTTPKRSLIPYITDLIRQRPVEKNGGTVNYYKFFK